MLPLLLLGLVFSFVLSVAEGVLIPISIAHCINRSKMRVVKAFSWSPKITYHCLYDVHLLYVVSKLFSVILYMIFNKIISFFKTFNGKAALVPAAQSISTKEYRAEKLNGLL